jgi:hypothetical protein
MKKYSKIKLILIHQLFHIRFQNSFEIYNYFYVE